MGACKYLESNWCDDAQCVLGCKMKARLTDNRAWVLPPGAEIAQFYRSRTEPAQPILMAVYMRALEQAIDTVFRSQPPDAYLPQLGDAILMTLESDGRIKTRAVKCEDMLKWPGAGA